MAPSPVSACTQNRVPVAAAPPGVLSLADTSSLSGSLLVNVAGPVSPGGWKKDNSACRFFPTRNGRIDNRLRSNGVSTTSGRADRPGIAPRSSPVVTSTVAVPGFSAFTITAASVCPGRSTTVAGETSTTLASELTTRNVSGTAAGETLTGAAPLWS
jgi:hypothetical protein